jgi:hypothetical protein
MEKCVCDVLLLHGENEDNRKNEDTDIDRAPCSRLMLDYGLRHRAVKGVADMHD